MKKRKTESFWANGLSVDETRFSMLALLSVTGFIYALFADFNGGISDNLLSLVNSVLIAFVSVNVVNGVSHILSTKNSDKEDDKTYNDDEGGHG